MEKMMEGLGNFYETPSMDRLKTVHDSNWKYSQALDRNPGVLPQFSACREAIIKALNSVTLNMGTFSKEKEKSYQKVMGGRKDDGKGQKKIFRIIFGS